MSNNGNNSFTRVQNVASVDLQEVDIGQITTSKLDVSNLLVIPTLNVSVENPQAAGVQGQIAIVRSSYTNITTLNIYYEGDWHVILPVA